MTLTLTQLLLCATVALTPVASMAQSSAELTAEDMRVLAQDLLTAGQPSDAGEVLNALLARDPQDVPALILGAQAALDQGQPAAAADLAARGYGHATSDAERYVAARLAARAQAEQLHDTRAQIWLRRARQYAPDAANAGSVAEDYAFVRDRNPLSLSLSFGLNPSSNINNGSRLDVTDVPTPFGLLPGGVLTASAKALSGLGVNLGGSLTYRLAASDKAATFFSIAADSTSYILSAGSQDDLAQEARRTGSDPLTGWDFSYARLSFGLIHRRVLTQGAQPTTFSARLGQDWVAGAPYQYFLDLGAAQSFRLGEASNLTVNVGLLQELSDVSRPDITTYALALGYTRGLANGNVLGLTLSNRRAVSDDDERDTTTTRLGATFDLAQPIRDFQLGFGVSIEQRDYDYSLYTLGPRTDRTVGAQVSALATQIEYYGFQPVATLNVGRTFSDSGRFDTQFATFGIDLQSSF